jgi:hypothetical protein
MHSWGHAIYDKRIIERWSRHVWQRDHRKMIAPYRNRVIEVDLDNSKRREVRFFYQLWWWIILLSNNWRWIIFLS